MPNLNEIPLSSPCCRCGQGYGLHEHLEGRCPKGGGYSKTQTFQSVGELDALIAEAEEAHIAAGLLVDLKADELTDAVIAQANTRRRLMELRKQNIAAEVQHG